MFTCKHGFSALSTCRAPALLDCLLHAKHQIWAHYTVLELKAPWPIVSISKFRHLRHVQKQSVRSFPLIIISSWRETLLQCHCRLFLLLFCVWGRDIFHVMNQSITMSDYDILSFVNRMWSCQCSQDWTRSRISSTKINHSTFRAAAATETPTQDQCANL